MKIYQIQVALAGFKPKIWRRLLVPSVLLLSDFHKIIQTSMGWTNSHLHQFIKDQTFYAKRYPDDDTWEELNNVDYAKIKISNLLKKEKDKIVYEYDFGDSWEHDIILEKVLSYDQNIKYPVCVAGKMNCPPEDCGGVWGYSDMLEILKNPNHEEYDSFTEWLGEEFDPEYFDKGAINKMLLTEDYGCIELFD
jgi:hypothetical protein